MATQIQQNRCPRFKYRTNGNDSEIRSVGLSLSPIPLQPCRLKANERKRVLPKEISLIMLLLAVKTASEISMGKHMLSLELIANSYGFASSSPINSQEQSNPYFNSIPSGKYTSFTELYSDGILTSTMSRCSSFDVVNNEDSDEHEEDSKARESILEDDDKLAETLCIHPPHKLTAKHRRFAYDDAIWEGVFSCLTWQETLRVREVSRFHYLQSLPFACLTRLPISRQPAVFIPCHEDLDNDEQRIEQALRPRPRATRGCRIFLGQLRRAGTVAMVRWLLGRVLNAPSGTLVSVENHRNAITGQGKGCVWPTILDTPTALRLLRANHRMLFDSVGGVEGMWVMPVSEEKALKTEIQRRNRDEYRPKHLPRGTIVVELPVSLSQPVDTVIYEPPPSYDDFLKMPDSALGDPFDNRRGVMFLRPGVWRHDPYQCSVLN
ncbi:unnamed protein product [Phytomonas sp. Hart1]|nr:unnamed protein product [Phytomonas sp. Hart1]|eukprot:CCW66331.1 unnamed protein product [Phytomonas sp. isolate Hart1]